MSDTQMMLGEKRQGHPTSTESDWRSEKLTDDNLPHTIQMGQEFGFKRETTVTFNEEILWQNELNRILNKSILPKTYRIGTRCMKFVVKNATALVSKQVDDVINKHVGGRLHFSSLIKQHSLTDHHVILFTGYHRSYGTQVDFHRDGRNARLIASAFNFGFDYEGGELILPQLGLAIHAGPGYSIHGCYDILVHGIAQIRSAEPDTHKPPVRISLAMYPQASVYSGAARFSAFQKGNTSFSDSSLWLPFYPQGFQLESVKTVLAAEEKRLYRKYRNEVLDYKGLPLLPKLPNEEEEDESD